MIEPSTKEFHATADVSARRIARVYAQALLDAADKAGTTDEVLNEFQALILEVFGAEPRLETLFSSAAVGRIARQAALEKVFQDRASPLFYSFLQVLNDHERLDLLRPILAVALEVNDQRHRRLRVHVATAVPMPQDQAQRLEEGLRNHFGLEPVMFLSVDPTLLGGLRVRIGDMLYDATVKARIDNLRQQILARSSHEIQSGRDRFSSEQ